MNALEITVGFSISLSGKFQLQGQQALQGFLLWQSYINAQGGIAIRAGEKRAIRIWYDDRSRINGVRENVVRLFRTDHVDILLGPYSSSLTASAVEIAEEQKKILWNYGGSSDEIFSHGHRYLVGIASPASDYLRDLPRRLAEEFSGLNRICVLYSGTAEPSDGTLPAGFFDPPSQLPAIPSISSHSTFPGRITTPSSVSYLVSVRRLLCSRAAFRTS